MVKLVRNKTIKDYESRQTELSKANETLQETIEVLNERNELLTSMISDLEAKLDAYAEENSLTLAVSDDLTHVVPSVRVKKEAFEKMVELGYLDDTVNSETKPFAMQLALMQICSEALEQIMESFSSSFEE